jgi:hypothetical protein
MMTIRPICAAAILLAGIARPINLPADESAAAQREQTMTAIQMLRNKVLPPPSNQALQLEVDGDELDSNDRMTLRADFAGRFIRESSGWSEQKSGFDGTECWHRDALGLSKALAFADRDLLVFLSHFRTGQWLNHVTPEMLELVPECTNDQVTTFVVHHHRATSRVEFDNPTGLPSWFEMEGTQGRVRYGFADYQRHGDVPIPMTVTSTSFHETRTSRVEAVQLLAPLAATAFQRLDSLPARVHFDPAVPAALTVRRSPTGHVLVDVSFSDGVPRTFVFDTGAGGTLVDRQLAQSLGFHVLGEQLFVSILGNTMAEVVETGTLQIGPATLTNPRLVATDIDVFRTLLGDPSIAGVIGYDLLSQCACEITLSTDQIQVFPESAFQSEQHADLPWHPIAFYQNIPLVPARFPQGEGMFRIDVGAASGPAGNVIFHTPAVKRWQMPTTALPKVQAGEAELAIGTIAWFELSGHRFESPTVIYSLAQSGPLAEPGVDGNIGVEFLKPFRIILDYRHARMAFVPMDP